MNLTIDEQFELLSICHHNLKFVPIKTIDDLYKRLKVVENQFKKACDKTYKNTFITWINTRNIGELMINKDIDIVPLLPVNKTNDSVRRLLASYLDAFNIIKDRYTFNLTDTDLDVKKLQPEINTTDAIKIFIKYMDTQFIKTDMKGVTLSKFFELVSKNNISCDTIIKYEKQTTNYDILFALLLKYSADDVKLLIENNVDLRYKSIDDIEQYDFILKCLKDKTVTSFNIPIDNLEDITTGIYATHNHIETDKIFENFKKFVITAQKRNITYDKLSEKYMWLLCKTEFNITICNRIFDHIEKGFKPSDNLIPILIDLKILLASIPSNINVDQLIRVMYTNNIKINPIFDFLSDKANFDKIKDFSRNYSKAYADYLQSNIITDKKDANLLKKMIQSNIQLVDISHIEKLLNKLCLQSINLIDILYILQHSLIDSIYKYIPNNSNLTIEEVIRIAEFTKTENIIANSNLENKVNFIKKHSFNKNSILAINKNLRVKTIIEIYCRNFTNDEIAYLIACDNDKYVNIIINNFDINKTYLENVYNNIKNSDAYTDFINLSNGEYDIPESDIIELYAKDIFHIHNSFIRNYYVSDTSKNLYKSMLDAYINNRFTEEKFKTLNLELDETIPNSIVENWKQCYITKISDYEVFDTIDLNLTMQIGSLPVSTCMDYELGIYSDSLVSNLDANKKIIFVKNKKGQIVARSILKLTKIRTGSLSENTLKKSYALIIERVYTSDSNPKIPKLISDFVKHHYKNLIVLGQNSFGNRDAKNKNMDVFVTYSRNKTQYFDSLGGEIEESDMGGYKNYNMYML